MPEDPRSRLGSFGEAPPRFFVKKNFLFSAPFFFGFFLKQGGVRSDFFSPPGNFAGGKFRGFFLAPNSGASVVPRILPFQGGRLGGLIRESVGAFPRFGY
eukprot:FR740204.1.p1 GENE.FR740204.1~~FR740204.1.p1  ORF type:complete len:100 (-),score=29.40 FR740204.1:279-578(-)